MNFEQLKNLKIGDHIIIKTQSILPTIQIGRVYKMPNNWDAISEQYKGDHEYKKKTSNLLDHVCDSFLISILDPSGIIICTDAISYAKISASLLIKYSDLLDIPNLFSRFCEENNTIQFSKMNYIEEFARS